MGCSWRILLPTRKTARSEERRVGKEWRWPRDWSSDVCSSDLGRGAGNAPKGVNHGLRRHDEPLLKVKMEVKGNAVEVGNFCPAQAPGGAHALTVNGLLMADIAADQKNGVGRGQLFAGHVELATPAVRVGKVQKTQAVINVFTAQGAGQAGGQIMLFVRGARRDQLAQLAADVCFNGAAQGEDGRL